MQCHFLIIDDDPVDRLIIKRIASKLGVEICFHEAESVQESIVVCRQQPISMVLMDLRLTVTKGIDTVEAFRSAVPDVKLFVTSGVPLPEIEEAAERLAISDFVIKSEITGEVIAGWIQVATDSTLSEPQRPNFEPSSCSQAAEEAIASSIQLIDTVQRVHDECAVTGGEIIDVARASPSKPRVSPSKTANQSSTIDRPVTRFVMIADDEESDVLILSRQLCTASHGTVNITAMNSGIDAIASLTEMANSPALDLPDIVFLDLNMPRKDGYQTLLEIRNDKRLKELPIVIYSTSISESARRLADVDDATHLMEKPFGRTERIHQVKLLREKWFTV